MGEIKEATLTYDRHTDWFLSPYGNWNLFSRGRMDKTPHISFYSRNPSDCQNWEAQRLHFAKHRFSLSYLASRQVKTRRLLQAKNGGDFAFSGDNNHP